MGWIIREEGWIIIIHFHIALMMMYDEFFWEEKKGEIFIALTRCGEISRINWENISTRFGDQFPKEKKNPLANDDGLMVIPSQFLVVVEDGFTTAQ
jgi:hypothetical protein